MDLPKKLLTLGEKPESLLLPFIVLRIGGETKGIRRAGRKSATQTQLTRAEKRLHSLRQT
jgi:hypothetical protein